MAVVTWHDFRERLQTATRHHKRKIPFSCCHESDVIFPNTNEFFPKFLFITFFEKYTSIFYKLKYGNVIYVLHISK